MKDYIKMIVIPEDTESIDFVFYPTKKDNKPDYLVESMSKDDDIKRAREIINNYSEEQRYVENHIYHFDCLRNYLKNYHFKIYYKLKLDDSRYQNINDSYVLELLNVLKEMTNFNFISILNTNSDSVTIIYVNENISEIQRQELEVVKGLISDKSIIEIAVCNGLDIVKMYNGKKDVIDQYLNEYKAKKVR